MDKSFPFFYFSNGLIMVLGTYHLMGLLHSITLHIHSKFQAQIYLKWENSPLTGAYLRTCKFTPKNISLKINSEMYKCHHVHSPVQHIFCIGQQFFLQECPGQPRLASLLDSCALNPYLFGQMYQHLKKKTMRFFTPVIRQKLAGWTYCT